MKYVNESIVFQEIPDEVTLAVNLSGCPCRCPGCHSKFLWDDIGTELTPEVIDSFAQKYGEEITCIGLMGGDANHAEVCRIARYIHEHYPHLKVGWYSGRMRLSKEVDKQLFDYIKIGPYIAHLGPLKKRTTNQRMYRKEPDGAFRDITERFWQ